MNEVRRCDEMERKLRYIEAEVRKDGVPIVDNLTELPRAPNPRMIIDLEVITPSLSCDLALLFNTPFLLFLSKFNLNFFRDIHTIDLYRNLSKISIESVRILKDENEILLLIKKERKKIQFARR